MFGKEPQNDYWDIALASHLKWILMKKLNGQEDYIFKQGSKTCYIVSNWHVGQNPWIMYAMSIILVAYNYFSSTLAFSFFSTIWYNVYVCTCEGCFLVHLTSRWILDALFVKFVNLYVIETWIQKEIQGVHDT